MLRKGSILRIDLFRAGTQLIEFQRLRLHGFYIVSQAKSEWVLFSPTLCCLVRFSRVNECVPDRRGTNCVPFFPCACFLLYFLKVTVPVSGMITIPAASLAGAQIVQTGANTNTTSSGQGTVTVTLPVAGNVVNSGGMVMVRILIPQLTVRICNLFSCISLCLWEVLELAFWCLL